MRYRGKVAVGAIVAVLLLLGIASPALAAPESSDVVHVVQRGENLTLIARSYGVNMWVIARANGITNPNRIYPGQRLVIPCGSPSGGRIHIVKPGETLTGIAWRYGMDPWAIARANGITNLNRIYVGQRLVIPGKAPPPVPKPVPPVAKPPQPATWLGPWSAEYFDNRVLSGPPALLRSDEKIAFDWGYGAAADGLPKDNFSVRWTGSFTFEEGEYRLYAKIDDGVKVYIDDVLVINGWKHGSLRTYSTVQKLAAGEHVIKVEYYDYIQVARAYFWIAQESGGAPPAPAPSPVPPPAGWYAEFFNNKGLTGDPVHTRVDPWIGFEWGTDGPAPGVWADNFSARWTNTVALEVDHYRFCAMADDGVRIWVNEQLVLDHWHPNNGTSYCGTFYSEGGTYPVKVEYFEDGGDALIYVWWEPH